MWIVKLSATPLKNRLHMTLMTLISRSQAKRLLSGFKRFSKISLAFEGITCIGQGFADETFHVYKKVILTSQFLIYMQMNLSKKWLNIHKTNTYKFCGLSGSPFVSTNLAHKSMQFSAWFRNKKKGLSHEVIFHFGGSPIFYSKVCWKCSSEFIS